MTQNDFILARSRIAIIGLGLMGGSLAMALRGKCAALFGLDTDQTVLDIALSRSIVDRVDTHPARLVSEADMIILATPVPAILSLLEQLPSYVTGPCIVLDVGSTKQSVVEAMNHLPKNFDPLGGHPICGKENLSIANAEPTLYHSTIFVLSLLKRTSQRALYAAYQVIAALGARPITLDAGEHDRLLAFTSHLPFLLSSALALATPQEASLLVGPGFKSTSRLAGTPSSMMMGVIQTNRENILNALYQMQSRLNDLELALSSGDYLKLCSMLEEAQGKYRFFVK